MTVQSIETCTQCSGAGFVVADKSIPVHMDGRYKICDTCGGSGNVVVEHEETPKSFWTSTENNKP